MFLSLFLTCVVALGISTLLLVTFGARIKIRSTIATLILSVIVIAASGEIAARIWELPSRYVVTGQCVMLGVGVLVMGAFAGWNLIGKVFYATLVASSGSYLAFAAWYTVRGGLSPVASVASGVLFFLEAGALVISLWYAFDSCDAICRVKWRRPEPTHDPSHVPMVSLQIAAYNEPPEMLIETIKSVEAIDYRNFEVVVIDNNTKDPEVWRPVEEYCRDRPNVRFEHVEDWPGFKAGALNLAMSRFTDPKAEIVGVIDADYLVDPNYLKEVVGYFADPNIAFVQTPQDYRDWEGDRYLTACADAYEYFFATTMPSRNDRNSIIFAGTMGLIRRKALEDLGGWEEWCITEDSEASLRILKAGHSGLFVGKSYGKGVMPLTFAAFKSQRFRWCFGGIQIVRRHRRELMPWNRDPENHLTLAQRLDYLFGSLHWFNDLLYLGFTMVLLTSAVLLVTTGRVAIRPLLGAVTLLPAALIGSGLLRALWALRLRVNISTGRALRAFANWLSLSWTVAIASAAGIFRSEAVFMRTPKSEDRPRLIDALRATKVETTLALLLWGSAGYLIGQSDPAILLIILFVWQGTVYATAPYMAWLNQRASLSEELQRRRATESMRERFTRRLPYYAAGSAALAGAAVLVALLFFGGTNPGRPANPFAIPERPPGDEGPLTNIVNDVPVAPSVPPTPEATVTETPEPSPEESLEETPTPTPSPTTSEEPTVEPTPTG